MNLQEKLQVNRLGYLHVHFLVSTSLLKPLLCISDGHFCGFHEELTFLTCLCRSQEYFVLDFSSYLRWGKESGGFRIILRPELAVALDSPEARVTVGVKASIMKVTLTNMKHSKMIERWFSHIHHPQPLLFSPMGNWGLRETPGWFKGIKFSKEIVLLNS